MVVLEPAVFLVHFCGGQLLDGIIADSDVAITAWAFEIVETILVQDHGFDVGGNTIMTKLMIALVDGDSIMYLIVAYLTNYLVLLRFMERVVLWVF